MGTFALPPGFRFHPTDEELISCYLKGKLNHGLKAAELEVISEVDLYKLEPWDLPEKSFLPSTDMEWYFFSPRDRKYPNGCRTNRATEAGYWKATGRDRKIYSRASTIGIKKTLVFYRGRAPQGERTDWVMHEYRLEENESEAGPCLQNAFVLCRVFKKSGLGEKSGEQYTAPVEKGDLSLIKKNLSPGYFGDIEVHSEEQSKPVEGIDANSHLPSKISSKILNDTTGDSAPLNKWLDILLDDTNSNSSCVAPDEDTIHTQVDAMPDTPRTQCESACLPFDESEFPQIPVNISFSQYGVPNGCLDAYFEEERMLDEMLSAASQDYTNSKAYRSFIGDTFADILNGGYIEVKNLLPSMEEPENHDSCLWEVPNPSLHHEGTGIQICSRSPVLQSHKQGILSEGTAARRVCMQLHKMEDSAERNEKDVNARHSQNMLNDWYDSKSGSTSRPEMQQLHFDQFDGQKCDSENIRENEDSAPDALATYMAGRIDGFF